MKIVVGRDPELDQLLSLVQQLGTQMTKLQTAIAELKADVDALAAAQTAAQANQFTADDVANVQAIGAQVKAQLAALTPDPAPPLTPDQTPAS